MVLGASVLGAWGCRTSTPFEDLAPPSPDRPWLSSGEAALAPTLESIATGELAPRPEHRDAARSGEGLPWLGEPPPIDPDRRYGLAELIDLAQRTNPGTRVAWERAREAAIAIGLVEGAYEPMLAASLMAGYERAVFPIPEVPPLIDSNSFSAETADLVPGLELTWLLYDFGRREAAESLAKSRAVFADAEFNLAHSEIAYAVTVAYHAKVTSIERVSTAEVSAAAAEKLEAAVRSLREHGLATDTQLLAAVRGRVQAQFEVETARAAVSTTGIDLLEAIGLAPDTRLEIEFANEELLPELAPRVETLVAEAIGRRQDLAASVAKYQATQAELRLARAGRNPTVTAGANVSIPLVGFDVDGTGWESVAEPWYGAWVGISVPLLDGEITDTRVRMALASVAAASAEIAVARDRAVREVWRAYNDLATALRQRSVIKSLLAASEANFESAMASFDEGLATFVEVDEARRGLADSRLVDQDSRAAIRIAAANLAMATGRLAPPTPRESPPAPPR
ncbi:MAG: TolC family protein [Phycisphaerales bacterium]